MSRYHWKICSISVRSNEIKSIILKDFNDLAWSIQYRNRTYMETHNLISHADKTAIFILVSLSHMKRWGAKITSISASSQ